MMQIFLAVSVLVYSVTMSKAGYEVRSEKLNECGDKLKDLSRQLDREVFAEGKESEKEITNKYNERYSSIISDTENHSDKDYWLAKLDMTHDYEITGIRRLAMYAVSYANLYAGYIIPITMMIAELLFVTDMIGATSFYPDSFRINQ